jgi:hypothetical protein
MGKVLGLERHRCMARATALLVTIALIAGMASCAFDVVIERSSCTLTVASDAGGSVTTPGEGKFVYDAKTVVNLVAEADAGYRFVTWTGNVATIADVDAAITTITMNNGYSITARFEAIPPDQYSLTIASTAGGRVITPGEGTFLYDEGTLVDLVAEAEDGYQFINWIGDVGALANINSAVTTITMNGDYVITAKLAEQVPVEPMVAAGGHHTVGLKSDGTLVGAGLCDMQRDVTSWTAIFQVAARFENTVGLRFDGTVLVVGLCDEGQCDVSGWTDIIQIAAGYFNTVGLRANGTVVAVGSNERGQRNVQGWTDVIQVAAGAAHTVGLRSDGTVVAVGWNEHGQRDVADWTDIMQIATGWYHTVGLRSNGTVVAVGGNEYGQRDVADWTDIIQVAAGWYHTVGIKSDGSVVAVGDSLSGQCNVGSWTDIIQVAAGGSHTVGLKVDGTVVAVGYNGLGQCDVSGWNLAG